MKFGSQLRSKSVPEWRSYNIDYNELKLKIRIATGEHTTQEMKKDLYDSFIEQIDTVNLFLTSKMGELKRRILYIEELIESIDKNDAVIDIISSQLTKLNKDLRNLARFISIQKTALRKLLKKYTKYSKDGGELNTKVNKYMIQNNGSFIYIDISGFYLEISLIYDLVRNLSHAEVKPTPATTPTPQHMKRRSSHANPIENLSKNDTFDFQSVKEGNYSENFLVHYDNLAELKLFLLANFFCIDDSTSNQLKNLQLIKQQSSLSLKDVMNKKGSTEDQQQHTEEQTVEGEDLQPSSSEVYRSNSIYLNKEDPLTNSSFSTQILLDDPKQFQSIKNNTDPGYLLTDLSNANIKRASFLISAIGGLRKCSNVTLSDYDFSSKLLAAVLNNETFESFYAANESTMLCLDSLEKVSIEWLFTKHIKPVLKVKSSKTRFSTTNVSPSPIDTQDKSQAKVWITLNSNIEFDIEDMSTTDWTATNESGSNKFPYAHLSIRYNSLNYRKVTEEDDNKTSLDELLESHLIYKIDNSFNLLTYSLFLYNKLPFQPTWMNLFTEDSTVDIRKLPPKPQRQKTKPRTSFGSDSDATSHKHSISSETTTNQLRYWNEFDHGSDFEDDAGFMINVESTDEGEFQIFSDTAIENFYKASFKLSALMSRLMPGLFDPIEESGEHSTLTLNGEFVGGYGSAAGADLEAVQGSAGGDDSDSDSIFLATRYQEQKFRNDKFKLFLSLASSLFSDFITLISTIIVFSVFSQQGIVVGKLIWTIVLSSMVLAMFFSSLSLVLLLNTDENYRNDWQTGFVWTSFFSVSHLIFLIIPELVKSISNFPAPCNLLATSLLAFLMNISCTFLKFNQGMQAIFKTSRCDKFSSIESKTSISVNSLNSLSNVFTSK
ncbi:hypothetical protein WICPIJ_004634 [Wickerhamomyces pijperi]|uniref:SPX domain-containing protein n=1 Tax=Wickerhamomyces pijperi TaxID=599730 RepID=A0A9P8TMQ2_WICPI|nr:hypothetical protein WICPIJ_004634 [Wickerhamomyces pijperi]